MFRYFFPLSDNRLIVKKNTCNLKCPTCAWFGLQEMARDNCIIALLHINQFNNFDSLLITGDTNTEFAKNGNTAGNKKSVLISDKTYTEVSNING